MRAKLIGENMKMALETIRTHKVRSFLTVLGVVIGVAVAIVVASILLGVEQNVQSSFDEFGIDNLWVGRFNMGFRVGRTTPEERSRKPLTYDDGVAIQEEAPAVQQVSIEIFPRMDSGPRSSPSARYKGREMTTIDYHGATSTFAEVENLGTQDGRFFTEAEDLHHADVAVIGADVARRLYPDESPVGKPIQVSGNFYTVIGVFDKRKNTTIDQGQDNDVLIPYRTYRKDHPQDDEHFFVVAARPGMKAMAEDQIRGLLRLRRRVPPGRPDNFGISSAEQLGNQFRDIMAGVLQLVVGVVSIGLLVGGVGVMNIMLMSVTERTREIGVRKAIGASRRDISFQFLTEAMTLTGAGGVIGVALSLIVSFCMRLMHMPSAIPGWAVGLAVAVAGSVGLFFGIYPAIKAARLDPVDALRYE